MANLKEEYKLIPNFKVIVDKKVVHVPRSTFQREWRKYAGMGYGLYFDISQEEAMKLAKVETDKKIKAKKEAEQSLLAAQKESESKDEALVKMDAELKSIDGQLSKAKETVDKQQEVNAGLVQDKQKLTASKKKVSDENKSLKLELEEMKKKMAASDSQ